MHSTQSSTSSSLATRLRRRDDNDHETRRCPESRNAKSRIARNGRAKEYVCTKANFKKLAGSLRALKATSRQPRRGRVKLTPFFIQPGDPPAIFPVTQKSLANRLRKGGLETRENTQRKSGARNGESRHLFAAYFLRETREAMKNAEPETVARRALKTDESSLLPASPMKSCSRCRLMRCLLVDFWWKSDTFILCLPLALLYLFYFALWRYLFCILGDSKSLVAVICLMGHVFVSRKNSADKRRTFKLEKSNQIHKKHPTINFSSYSLSLVSNILIKTQYSQPTWARQLTSAISIVKRQLFSNTSKHAHSRQQISRFRDEILACSTALKGSP